MIRVFNTYSIDSCYSGRYHQTQILGTKSINHIWRAKYYLTESFKADFYIWDVNKDLDINGRNLCISLHSNL